MAGRERFSTILLEERELILEDFLAEYRNQQQSKGWLKVLSIRRRHEVIVLHCASSAHFTNEASLGGSS